MKNQNTEELFQHIRQLPEEISYEKVAAFVAITPVATAAGWGLAKALASLIKAKFLIPMLFTSTTLGFAVWYTVQSITMGTESSALKKNEDPNAQSVPVNLSKDQVFGSGSIAFGDSAKKKKPTRKIIRYEQRVVTDKMGKLDSSQTELEKEIDSIPPLPPLPPLPPGARIKEVKEVKKIVKQDGSETTETEDREIRDSKKKTDKLLEKAEAYLLNQKLIDSKTDYSFELKEKSLEVNGKKANYAQQEELMALYRAIEKGKLKGDSFYSATKKKGRTSVSKSIESEKN
jgi:hypothetical protein